MIDFSAVMNAIGAGGLLFLVTFAARSLRTLGRIESEFHQVRSDLLETKADVKDTRDRVARIEGSLSGRVP